MQWKLCNGLPDVTGPRIKSNKVQSAICHRWSNTSAENNSRNTRKIHSQLSCIFFHSTKHTNKVACQCQLPSFCLSNNYLQTDKEHYWKSGSNTLVWRFSNANRICMYYVLNHFTLQIVELYHKKLRWQFCVWKTSVSSLDLDLLVPVKAIHLLPVLLKLKHTIPWELKTLLIWVWFF